uniref:ATP synthase subunit delta', mitochondrial n=1 Tax=Oryza nivara TaxID=4536 RepID=A0A0E0I125_ORYNI
MLRHAARRLATTRAAAAAAAGRSSRVLSTAEVPAEAATDSAFAEAWKKVAPNIETPATPMSLMQPRPPTLAAIPSKLTVNFVLPYKSEIANKEADCYGSWRRQSALAIHHLPMGTIAAKILPWEAPSRETLLRTINAALDDGNVDDVLQAFANYKTLHGLPEPRVLDRMIVSLSYASSRRWLQRAFDMVLSVYQCNGNLLNCGSLMKLALALARDQMPIPASTVVRIILESGKLPDVDMLTMVYLHMVKSQVGSYLAADVLCETCECFLEQIGDRRQLKKLDPIKSNVTLFNMVLKSCVDFKCMIKAQRIMELMSLVGVVADVNTVAIASLVFEMVGQRVELVNMKRSIDSFASLPFIQHYLYFYGSLLNLHFKYNDMDAAAQLLVDLYRQQKPRAFVGDSVHKQGVIQIGSGNLKTGFRIMFDPIKVDKGFVLDTESQFGLLAVIDGNIRPSEKALAKFIVGCLKASKVRALSSFLITLHKEDLKGPSHSDVISACILMGWLHAAHDILDDLESAEIPVLICTYMSLLRAYEKENKPEEVNRFLQQIQKKAYTMADFHTNPSFTIKDVAKIVKDEMPLRNSSLLSSLVQEIEHYSSREHLTFEFNNSILFFCKANMMDDALSTYKRMREQNVRPSLHTFCHILCGYSSLGMHREIAMLWGEIKRRLEYGELTVDRDLLDCLILNFLNAGYFARVMEVLSYMANRKMYCDKWKYKQVFLKLHKNLYRNLNLLHEKTEQQSKRIEDVRAFRSWAGDYGYVTRKMLRHAARRLATTRAAAAAGRSSRALSTAEVPAEAATDSAFAEAWKKVAPNIEAPATPMSLMQPRPPTLAAIPSKLTVNFVLPYKSEIANKEVDMVIVPATTGQMGVLPGHVSTIAELKPGVLSVHEGNDITKYFVSSGFAFVHANSIADIVAVEAVPLDQIDPAAVQQGLAEFNAKLGSASTELEKAEAQIGVDVHSALNAALAG